MDAWCVWILALIKILFLGKFFRVTYILSLHSKIVISLYIHQVSNSFVTKKISVILYPPLNKVWNRLQADEFEREGEVSANIEPVGEGVSGFGCIFCNFGVF